MFGIGFGEFAVVAIILLIAVGPSRLPALMKTVGKGLREFRRATRELRDATGIDEMMRDDDFRDPLRLRPGVRRVTPPVQKPAVDESIQPLEYRGPEALAPAPMPPPAPGSNGASVSGDATEEIQGPNPSPDEDKNA